MTERKLPVHITTIKWMLAAGVVHPGTSSSVEIFTADLLIPEPGLQVAFTFKPNLPASQLSLELWCWMEPSNRSIDSADTLTSTAPVAGDDNLGEFGGREVESVARSSKSGARGCELTARGCELTARGCESGPKTSESAGQMSESGCRWSESGARVLAMLQANGAVLVADEQAPGCTDTQAAREVAQL